MTVNQDQATNDYAAAVESREQAELDVVAAVEALNVAKAILDKKRVEEEVALYMLGIAVGIPGEKIIVSAQAKAAMEDTETKS